MGLLTNPKTRERLVNLVSRFNNKICFLCYIVGLGWFLALAYKPLNAGVYFSENALLPGLVTADFKNEHGASDFYNQLKDELKNIKEKLETTPQNIRDTSVLHSLPSEWFETTFRELGLDTYVQNYSFVYPAGVLRDQRFHGKNVYGILRAPRHASTEAIVMSVPYRPPSSDHDRTGPGIALLLSLAKAFRKHTYWAKDVIFLVTEHEQIGMQAWLSAYHYDTVDRLYPGELHGRSGSIQAAINLEIGSDTISRINIKMEGLNGQLPNLDLINTVVKLCRREGISVTLQKRGDFHGPHATKEGFEHALKTMLTMMWNQASNVPSGNHGLFHRYHIEAVTLQGIKMKNARRTYKYVEMGKVVEGVFRSLNNLLERFHQSFFFYLLPATDRYVSIGLYMPPFGVLALPIIIKALALWISYTNTEEAQTDESAQTDSKTEGSNASEDKSDETKSKEKEESGKKDETIKAEEKPSSALSLVPPCLMAVVFGLGTYRSPYFFVETSHAFHMPQEEGLMLGAIAVHFAAIIYPRIMKRRTVEKGAVSGANWQLQKCISLLSLGLVMAGLSVMNISLAFFITAITTPVVLAVRPVRMRLLNFVQFLMLLLISPIGLLFMACLTNAIFVDKITDPTELVLKTYTTAQNSLLSSVVDATFFGNWMFGLVTLVLFPVWLMFWSLLWANPN